MVCDIIVKKEVPVMKLFKNSKFIFIILSVAVLVANIVPVIIFRDSIGITVYSIPSLVIAFCSLIYAIIAIILREHFNLFFLNLYIIAKIFNKDWNKTDEYRKEFMRFAFVYCAAIPTLITISLLVDNMYAGIIRPLDVCIVRDVVIIVMGLLPPFVKNLKARKQQKVKDESDKREQERRESMGEWK